MTSFATFILVVFATGYPFIWCVLDFAWAGARRRWQWSSRRKFLALNALLYPFVFLMFGLVAVLIFGVDDEYAESIRSLDERSMKAIRDGAPPSWNNVALGIAFLSALFGNAVMVYTSGIGFLYFLGSTALHGRRGFDGLWQPPLGGIALGSLGIAVTYFYRTPIFNWIYS